MGAMINTLIDRQKAVIEACDYWVGESFRDKIDKLSEEEAFTRPIPGVHTVAELISHLLEWRKDNIRKLKGLAPKLLSIDATENWIPNDELKKRGWETLKQDFYAGVEELCSLVVRMDDDFLSQCPKGETYTYFSILDGLINHDIYHLGQIGITVKQISLR
jgi:Uncharacterized protein conserved in bacteria